LVDNGIHEFFSPLMPVVNSILSKHDIDVFDPITKKLFDFIFSSFEYELLVIEQQNLRRMLQSLRFDTAIDIDRDVVAHSKFVI